MSHTISVTSDTIDTVLADLPRIVRLALSFGARLRRGTLDVTLPDGRVIRLGGQEPGPNAAMRLHNYGFASRLINGGDIGIAEAYLAGDWDTPDLTQFLYLFCVNHDLIQAMLNDKPLMRFVQLLQHWFNRNTRRQARRNIHAHYDIGNAFYSAWLDPGMTYSSALFEESTCDLTAAQTNKYRRLAEALDLKPDQTLLEIGCGWGGFAEFAAKTFGTRVVGLTISTEQRDFAQKRIHEAGLADKVEIRLQDYRDECDRYDRIASIEMIEAVGEQFWPKYFAQLRDRLLPGGLAGIQAITIQDRLFQSYRREVDFIQRYVFPGGMLPSPAVLKSLGDTFGLPVIRERIFGQDYAKTLATWRNNFQTAWPGLVPLGFDDRFRRLWEYYLSYCEAGFLSGNIDVRQVIFAKQQ
ncbi:class I SAM-dependent methyltransferase [Bradyrhizobium sp. MOS001]|uniref:SAM-dependent methyltransferase n=1 Tax=unclassified Bradyrhizobium TaxID=2631580 RepID=UPI0010753617|nr:cyclopropane-fatty-acyl-phospholipid synthase family protein [Bradyrhizobium sp. MOS001]TFW62724.1 class I SAM-dependent methyltransferase [Bradyrhizobium sp. MOS001]